MCMHVYKKYIAYLVFHSFGLKRSKRYIYQSEMKNKSNYYFHCLFSIFIKNMGYVGSQTCHRFHLILSQPLSKKVSINNSMI